MIGWARVPLYETIQRVLLRINVLWFFGEDTGTSSSYCNVGGILNECSERRRIHRQRYDFHKSDCVDNGDCASSSILGSSVSDRLDL
jgi:hypothetical protein